MRHFEIQPRGQTSKHSHDWEHEVFIIEGKGLVICEDSE
jgi:quercetin dioxygenase-like cupin family protein